MFVGRLKIMIPLGDLKRRFFFLQHLQPGFEPQFKKKKTIIPYIQRPNFAHFIRSSCLLACIFIKLLTHEISIDILKKNTTLDPQSLPAKIEPYML